jgi:hypothetical protein
MRTLTSSNPRISVRLRLAVTITALITWGIGAYVGCHGLNLTHPIATSTTVKNPVVAKKDSAAFGVTTASRQRASRVAA